MRAGPLRLATLALLAALAGDAVAAEVGGLVPIPGGRYTPFERVEASGASAAAATETRPIAAFGMEAEPVTNAEFLAFVAANPQWRKSEIKTLFADQRYLRRWPSDLALADAAARDEPVTNVSWFAAKAYCKSKGLRLPTTEQWEYALADAGRGHSEIRQRSLDWFAQPNDARPAAVGAGPANGFGVRDLIGLIWEWTLDFDASRGSTDGGAFACNAAAARATDASDYAAFMRYSMRASLKANYTADNLGFRCAGGAP